MTAPAEPHSRTFVGDTAEEVARAGGYVRRLAWFLVLAGASVALAAAAFYALVDASFIDAHLAGVYRFVLARPALMAVAAFSPLAASLLVGWGYARRARRRREARSLVESAVVVAPTEPPLPASE